MAAVATFGRIGATFWLIAGLAACGGGGGGDAAPTPAPSPVPALSPSPAPAPAPAPVAPVAGTSPSTQRVDALVCGAAAARSTPVSDSQAVRIAPEPAGNVTLDPFTQARALAREAATSLPGVPRRIGAARAVEATGTALATRARWQWQDLPGGGRAAAMRFRSPDAVGLRLGLRVSAMPEGAVVRVRGVSGAPADGVATSGSDIMASIARNQAAGDHSDAGRTWWTPPQAGDTVTLDIELPPGTASDALDIAVPVLSHMFVTAADAEGKTALAEGGGRAKIGQSGSCNVDVSCNAAYTPESNAVARMTFVEGGSTFLCTGTLLNDRAGTTTPYFITANHCISNQTAASSLATDWFYRASACGSKALSPAARTLNRGATLLYASLESDTAFMRLNEGAPGGAVCAGWDPAAPTNGLGTAGLHQPSGDLQKLSIGSVVGFAGCSNLTINSEQFNCSPANADGRYLTQKWSSGVTEGGSSGSGLFTTGAGGKHYLIGTLYGGAASCSVPQGSDYYGRFDVAYRAAIYQWLEAPPAPRSSSTTSR